MLVRIYRTMLRFCAFFLTALLFLPGAASSAPAASPADVDVIVIGAGLGGLSAATHLAVNGYTVLVLEQHDKVGGCATRFERDEFTFDASLHAMAGGGPGKQERGLRRLLQLWGIDRKVEFIELPEFYRSIFPGVDIRLPSNWDGFCQALKRRWPQEADGIDRFRAVCAAALQDMMALRDLYRYGTVRGLLTRALVPLRQRAFFKYKDKTLQQVLDECFRSAELKAVVGQLWVYYGAPASELSALLALAATETYLTDGVWHVTGTSQALSDAYAERIAELGGVVKTGTRVTRVIMDGGTAAGIETTAGEIYTARWIVANTDPYQLTFKLVGKEHFPQTWRDRLNALKPANSLFGVYLGLTIDLAERGYTDSEIFYSPKTMDSKILHDAMMRGDYKEGCVAITFYTNFGDPVYAPEGKSVVTLTAYSDMAAWPPYGPEYYALKDKKTDELIALAAQLIPELADPNRVLVKEAFTPRTLNRYTLNEQGVVYGFHMTPETWEKIPNRTPIPNLFIASNWSQAWHGMGSAQVNGYRAAQLIMDRR